MKAFCLILLLAVLTSSTMAKPKTYNINEDDRKEQESIISSNLQYLGHQYDIANGNKSNNYSYVVRFIS